MHVRGFCAGLLAIGALGISEAQEAAPAPADADPGIAPFSAHYVAEWRGITVGSSDLELRRDEQPQHYHYKWTITARGIFHLVYSDDLNQESWLSIVDNHVRPDKYRATQGSSSVNLDFDWEAGRAYGTSETKPVDIKLKSGTQDLMSIQIEVMLDLKNGTMPPVFHILDKDELKDFEYTVEGRATLASAVGPLETVIVASRRKGNDRLLRMWFAPSLGYMPIQAERSRGGKLEFAMRLRSMKH